MHCREVWICRLHCTHMVRTYLHCLFAPSVRVGRVPETSLRIWTWVRIWVLTWSAGSGTRSRSGFGMLWVEVWVGFVSGLGSGFGFGCVVLSCLGVGLKFSS